MAPVARRGEAGPPGHGTRLATAADPAPSDAVLVDAAPSGLLLFAAAACWMIFAAVSDIHAPETGFSSNKDEPCEEAPCRIG